MEALRPEDLYIKEMVMIYASQIGIRHGTCYKLDKKHKTPDQMRFQCSAHECPSYIIFEYKTEEQLWSLLNHYNEHNDSVHQMGPNKFHLNLVVMKALDLYKEPSERLHCLKNLFQGCDVTDSRLRSLLNHRDDDIIKDPAITWKKVPDFLDNLERQGFRTAKSFED